VSLVQDIYDQLMTDLASLSGTRVRIPGIEGEKVLHCYVFGILGDLVEARDVTCVKKNACPVCFDDKEGSILRTPPTRLLDGSGSLPWVKAGQVCLDNPSFQPLLRNPLGAAGAVCFDFMHTVIAVLYQMHPSSRRPEPLG